MSVRDWFIAPAPGAADTAQNAGGAGTGWAPPIYAPGAAAPSCVAVLGRPGEAEPVAAAVALALCRVARSRAATVVVVDPAGEATAAAGGARAARRLAARLAAHGFEASARGRLAWVHASTEEARRAAVVGAPAVVAVTVPLTAALEATIGEQDLAVVVTPDRDGPLARLAIASLAHPGVVVAPPLARGLARRLAHAGLLAPRTAYELVANAVPAATS